MLKAIVLVAAAFIGLIAQLGASTAAQTGVASYYWQGRLTANGERYNPNGISAAHKTLPFGTLVKVTMLRSRRSIVVRINDRGPFVRGRIIDLSRGAAARIGLIGSGVGRVKIEVVGRRGPSGYVGNTRARRTKLARSRRGKIVQVARVKQVRSVGGAKKLRKAAAAF